MTKEDKLMIMFAHILAQKESDIQYLKALIMEKLNIPIEDFQQEQGDFWRKTQNFRVHQTIQTLLTLEQEVEALPQGMTLDMYIDHLRWPIDPPDEKE